MSFLAPWALLLAAAVAVPLLLHLLRRRSGTKVDFPAVRYLLRAEKEHAREVRLRNLLLMLLRVGIVVAIALAIARPLGPFPGLGHPPTHVVLVLDNSLSSGAAGADGPMLARLLRGAHGVIDASRAGDLLTLVTMDGEAVTGSAEALRVALEDQRAIDGAGDAAAAFRRAQAILDGGERPERQLVVLTDGQATQWRGVAGHAPAADPSPVVVPTADPLSAAVRTVVFRPDGTPPANRAVTALSVEPPHWSPRGALRATVSGDSASWRVVLGGRSVARGVAVPGVPVLARVQPNGRGWLAGSLELEPDELRGDDARHFAVYVGEAPAVNVDAASGAFLRGAVDALVDAGRARRGTQVYLGSAERAQRPGLLFAPTDPLKVADANRALDRAGVPWRFGAQRTGTAPLRAAMLDGATASAWFELAPLQGRAAETRVAEARTENAAAAMSVDTLARVGNAPWAVAGDGYVLIASAADAAATDLPLRAAFVPWLDALLSERLSLAAGLAVDLAPGASATVPSGVDAIEAPDGSLRAVRAGQQIQAPFTAGVHFWRRGERRAGALVVNPEPEESDLTPLAADALAAALGADRIVTTPEQLVRETFRAGGRRALDTPLLLLALVLLAAESLVARRGRGSPNNNRNPD